ncbi:MAG: hypothetical protein V1765_03755 [bacterium]
MPSSKLRQLFHIDGQNVYLSCDLLYLMSKFDQAIAEATLTYGDFDSTLREYQSFKKCIRTNLEMLSQELRECRCESFDRINQIEDLIKAATDNQLFRLAQLGFKSNNVVVCDYALENREILEKSLMEDFELEQDRQEKIDDFSLFEEKKIGQYLPGCEIPIDEQTVAELDEETYRNKKIKCCNPGEEIILESRAIKTQTPACQKTKNRDIVAKVIDQIDIGKKLPKTLTRYSTKEIIKQTNTG